MWGPFEPLPIRKNWMCWTESLVLLELSGPFQLEYFYMNVPHLCEAKRLMVMYVLCAESSE
jgi:hypothetical protein